MFIFILFSSHTFASSQKVRTALMVVLSSEFRTWVSDDVSVNHLGKFGHTDFNSQNDIIWENPW